jgi:hypothetical protein
MRYEGLLFSASILGAAIALNNCRHPLNICARSHTFSSPEACRRTELRTQSVGRPRRDSKNACAGRGRRFLKRTRHWRRVPVGEETVPKINRFAAALCVVIHTRGGIFWRCASCGRPPFSAGLAMVALPFGCPHAISSIQPKKCRLPGKYGA